MPPLYRILEIALYSLLNFTPFMLIALYPFRNKLRFSMKITVILIVAVSILQIFFGIWSAFFSSGYLALISAVSTITYFAFYFLAIKDHFGKLLFTLLMLSNIVNFTVMASKCLEGILFPENALQAYRWSFSVMMILVELLGLIPLFFYIKSTYSAVFEMDQSKSSWRFLWIIPATFYLIWYYHLYGHETSTLHAALDPVNTVILFLIDMGAMLIYHMVITLIREMDKNATLTSRNSELATQALRYENLKDRITEARRAKHDMKHHIMSMRCYLQNGEYDKLSKYLDGYCKSLPDDSTIVFCENFAVNALLLYFAQMAKNNGIDIVIHTDIPENITVPESDLSVILGNLLKNAIEACSEQSDSQKSICLKAKTEDSSIFITLDNTFRGELKQDKNGVYQSTKRNGSGLGIASVQSTVSRYKGDFRIEKKDGMFRVSLMLPLPGQTS